MYLFTLFTFGNSFSNQALEGSQPLRATLDCRGRKERPVSESLGKHSLINTPNEGVLRAGGKSWGAGSGVGHSFVVEPFGEGNARHRVFVCKFPTRAKRLSTI